MSTSLSHLDALSTEEIFRVHEAARRFERAWDRGERPEIDNFLPGDPVERRAVLRELVHADIVRRQDRGEAVRIDEYLGRYPELTEDSDAAASLAKSASPGVLVRRAGRYELREVVGSGSFGTVYRGWDPDLGREVAIKLPRTGTATTPEEAERFLREARAMAGLHHPGIVAVLDAGRGGGQCYLVAEFVAGPTLAGLLAAGRPSFRDSAALAARLADALDYAHHHGIVHRDLKPANVLMADGDTPRITDFGLARNASGDGTLTSDGHLLGTPAYMSPEQAAGDAARVGPASDQYSLGVILYEMLTGRLPFQGGVAEVLRKACEAEPPAPRRLCPTLPRDLERVCLKAMAPEPASRYPRAADLADDLRRYLAGDAVRARPVGPAGRLLRWCRRRPALAALAAALTVAVLAGLGGVTWQWRRAELQREQALVNLRQAHRLVNEFIILGHDPVQLNNQEIRPVFHSQMRACLGHYRTFLNQYEDDQALRPEAAAALARVGLLVVTLDPSAEGRREAETYYLKAERMGRELVDANPDDVEVRAELGLTCHRLGKFYYECDAGQSLAWFERSADLLQPLAGTISESVNRNRLLASCYRHAGSLHEIAGRVPEAMARFRQARSASETAPPDEFVKSKDWPSLAICDMHLSKLTLRDDPAARDEAIALAHSALALWVAVVGEYPDIASFRAEMAYTHKLLGTLYRDQDQPGVAVCQYLEAARSGEEVCRLRPDHVGWRASLASSWNGCGKALERAGLRENAADAFRRAVEHQRMVCEARPEDAKSRDRLEQLRARLQAVGEPSEASGQSYNQDLDP